MAERRGTVNLDAGDLCGVAVVVKSGGPIVGVASSDLTVGITWMTESDFFDQLPKDAHNAAKKVLRWARDIEGTPTWTPKEGYAHILTRCTLNYPLFYLTKRGLVKISVTRLFSHEKADPKEFAPFDDIEKRTNLIERIEKVTREHQPAKLRGERRFELTQLDTDALFDRFQELVTWMTAEIKRCESP